MSIKHAQTSVANKPKTLEDLTEDNARLEQENARLEAQLTDTQVALCEIYESLGA